MFTIPVSGSGILLVARPSASTGTITNAANAYDLPSSRADDPPYSTKASRATVTGSAVSGTVDYDTVEYNTFPSRSKTNFSQCQISVGWSLLLTHVVISNEPTTPPGTYANHYVTSSVIFEYQVDGTNWVQFGASGFGESPVAANNDFTGDGGMSALPLGTQENTIVTQRTSNAIILASAFPSNLNSLKIRIKLGTCTNNGASAYKSSGSYDIWDIRANIS